ncbi:E3 ubiquitin/ISG15 ligase TRIM25-like isoform X6 [Dicentrarchus labrax]|uniref:E3 ubiquitin/ISG15 ligase TRIM25-like isoform X6 n=1 Tax=Dicentrarchus labrax TaxID=13489 RepID=UPI0021F513EA|nr:E3 ubiquitin/ISG15 ligase TRIM25-like isoform X6 [Dicentrarchus labrax]
MAQRGNQLDRERFCCSICLDLLKDPVTIPCGHSYCMNCIKTCWEVEDQMHIHSCPQCRQTFTPRPVLMKNTMLADLVEELKKTGLQAAPVDHCYAGPEDVACHFCTEKKLKAIKSCLVCLASYCETHLQAHFESPTFKKHKLVDPSKKLQENICSRHDEVMKMFCRTDQQCICYLCSVDEHKGHDTVSAAAERTERQRELEVSRQNIQQRIQDREKDVKELQQQVEAINSSADKAVEDSEKIFTELIRLMEKRSSDVKQQVRSQQETEVSRVKELQEKLEQEITELKRKDAEMKKLSHTEDHNQFLHNYPSLSALSESTSSINIRPLRYFEDVTVAVSELRDKLQDVLKWTNVSLTVTEVDVLLPQPEPKIRAGVTTYSVPTTGVGVASCSRPTTGVGGASCSRPTTGVGGASCSRPTTGVGVSSYSVPTSVVGVSSYSVPTSVVGVSSYSRPTTVVGVSSYSRRTTGAGVASYSVPTTGVGGASYSVPTTVVGVSSYSRPTTGVGIRRYSNTNTFPANRKY